MKIQIPRQDLLDAVNKAKSVVSSKSALPILSHLLMESGESAIKISATDLKVSIECNADCNVEEPGSLTVSSQRLASILSELPEADIVMELAESNVIKLSCGRIQTKLFSMSPDEFPPIRSFEGVEPLVLQQSVLKKLFVGTSFAICPDQARYNLTGLLFEAAGGALTVVGTDGRRMSLCRETEGVAESAELKVIIPGKMISELEHLLGDDGEVSVFIDENQAGFALENVRVVTALIEGNFPNYDMVVPKKHNKEALTNTVQFLEAIRRTRTMTNDKFNSVRLFLSKGLLALRVVTPEVGEYEEELSVEYEGEPVEIAFNPDFVLDVVRHIESEMTCIVLKDSGSPGLLKPYTESPVDSYLNVIMPIRI